MASIQRPFHNLIVWGVMFGGHCWGRFRNHMTYTFCPWSLVGQRVRTSYVSSMISHIARFMGSAGVTRTHANLQCCNIGPKTPTSYRCLFLLPVLGEMAVLMQLDRDHCGDFRYVFFGESCVSIWALHILKFIRDLCGGHVC